MAIGNEKDPEKNTIWVTSLVSAKTGEGIVDFRWGETHAQLTVAEARNHAAGVYEVAEAAETDAFIVEFFEKELNCDRDKAIGILRAFRGYREKRRKENQS
jgi:hypothetical protein